MGFERPRQYRQAMNPSGFVWHPKSGPGTNVAPSRLPSLKMLLSRTHDGGSERFDERVQIVAGRAASSGARQVSTRA